MADTKISGLPAATSALGADELAINEAGTSKKLTVTQIQTLVLNAPIFAAGSASAGTKPTLSSGTLLTAAEAGAIEYDGTAFYLSPAGSDRAVNLCEYFVCLSGTYTLVSQTGAQKLFNATTNGALTLPVGTYFFECVYSLSSMSATSGNSQFQILGAGTAVLGSVLYHAVGIDGATGAFGAQTGSTSVASSSPASIQSAGVSTAQQTSIRGTFRVTSAGTIIPSVALVTAAAAIVAVGSYFRCRCMGSQTVQAVGNWS